MRIEVISEFEPAAHHRRTNAMDGLVDLLECNYATLEGLEMRRSSSRSSIRRQASICENGLYALRCHTLEAMYSASRHRCQRVFEKLRQPTRIEVVQNEYAGSMERWAGLEIAYGSWMVYGRLARGPAGRWIAQAGTREGAPSSGALDIYHGNPDSREEAAEQLNRAMLFMLTRAPDEGKIRRDLHQMGEGRRGPGFLTNHSLDDLRRVS